MSLTNYFVIDDEIDTSGLGIISDVAESAKTYLGGDRVRYTINQDLAYGIPINFGNDVDKMLSRLDIFMRDHWKVTLKQISPRHCT